MSEFDDGMQPQVPITLLSGFLGAGKTTVMQHVLTNNVGLKVGVLVNDVAETNIDSKLLSARKGNSIETVDTLELENGCMCCSLSDEVFTSLDRLLSIAESKKRTYDHIVIEGSGVAEPAKVRENFEEAVNDMAPIMDEVCLHNLVTVVDAADFLRLYEASSLVSAHPELGGEGGESTGLTGATGYGNDVGSSRLVVDLLVEQLECADTVVLNKIDRVSSGELQRLHAIVQTINPLATVHTTEFGKVKFIDALVFALLQENNSQPQYM